VAEHRFNHFDDSAGNPDNPDPIRAVTLER
jgi:hypothetical protein